ncbi:hypothetical protein BJ742DRAFT_682363 [Cladochytrium replicatum]|nr:hypothetical protein BJ742DRAFT_682363 [Cladochytrium replicatum]
MQEYFTRVPHEYILCGAQHPDYVECHNGWIKEFQCEWPRAFALYAPLNALMTIVFRGTRILKEPGRTLRSFIFQTLRSTLFLSGYVTTAWSLPCVFRRMVGKDHPWMYIVNGIFAGAWVMVENPGRRLELGLYCLPRAIQSLWNCWVQWGWVKNIPGGEALYFCLSMGMLMHFYQNDPESIHDGYYNCTLACHAV